MKTIILRMVGLVVTFSIFCAPAVYGEEITLKSYYPSPKGIYRELKVGRVFTNQTGGVMDPSIPPSTEPVGPNLPELTGEHLLTIKRQGLGKSDDDTEGCFLFSTGNCGDSIKFSHDGGADDLTIDPNGRIGIGTNAPNATLEVCGDIKVTGRAKLGIPNIPVFTSVNIAIPNPVEGDLVYSKASEGSGLFIYIDNAWKEIQVQQ